MYDISSNKYEFYLLGKNITMKKSKNLIEPFDRWIEDDEYEDFINSMHYCIFPFSEQLYKLRASGTLIEAIKYRIPIITNNNLYIKNYLLEAKIEYINFSLKETIVDILARLDNITEEEYFSMQNTINLYLENSK